MDKTKITLPLCHFTSLKSLKYEISDHLMYHSYPGEDMLFWDLKLRLRGLFITLVSTSVTDEKGQLDLAQHVISMHKELVSHIDPTIRNSAPRLSFLSVLRNLRALALHNLNTTYVRSNDVTQLKHLEEHCISLYSIWSWDNGDLFLSGHKSHIEHEQIIFSEL